MRTIGVVLSLMAILLIGVNTSERQDRCPELQAEMPDASTIAGDVKLSAAVADTVCTNNYEAICHNDVLGAGLAHLEGLTCDVQIEHDDDVTFKGSGELEYKWTYDCDNTLYHLAAKTATVNAKRQVSVLKLPRYFGVTSDGLSNGAGYKKAVAVFNVGVCSVSHPSPIIRDVPRVVTVARPSTCDGPA